MRTYYESRARKKLISKIAQSTEGVQPLSTQSPSQSPSSKLSDTSQQIQQIITEKEPEFTQKVEEYLSSAEVVKYIENAIAPYLKQEVDQFLQKHKENALQYPMNQELLIRDITSDFPFLKYVDVFMKILDAYFIGSTVLALAATVFSAGAASAVTIPEEAAKWGARKAIKSFASKFAKEIIIKIASRLCLSQLAKTGVSIGLDFVKQGMSQAARLMVLNTIESFIENGTIAQLKSIVATKGASEWNLPASLVAMIVKPETDAETARNIVHQAMEKTKADLVRSFSTQEGWKNLAYRVALKRLFIASGQGAWAIQLNRNVRESLGHLQQKLNPNQPTNQQTSSKLSDQILDNMISHSHIPRSLYPDYKNYLIQATKLDPDTQTAEKTAKTKLNSADLLVDSISNSVLGLGTLEFINENKNSFKNQPKEVENLLQNVVGSEISMSTLMHQTETTNLDSLIETLRKNKLESIQNQIGKLLVNGVSQKAIDSLTNYFIDQADMPSYKEKLGEEVFGGRYQVPQAKNRA